MIRSRAVTVDGKPALLTKHGPTWWLRWDGAVASKAAGDEPIEGWPEAFALPLDGWKVETR